MIGKTLFSRIILFIIAILLFILIAVFMPVPEALIGCTLLIILRAIFLLSMILNKLKD